LYTNVGMEGKSVRPLVRFDGSPERNLTERQNLVLKIEKRALRIMSDDDLAHLKLFFARDCEISESTPKERAALERFCDECDNVALKLTGRTMNQL